MYDNKKLIENIIKKVTHMHISQILENTVYFLALINPASKVLFLATKDPAYSPKEMSFLSYKSSFIAWVILVLLTFSGNFIMLTIFHVEIYSLSFAGGVILFIIGLKAVQKGNFYEKRDYKANDDISVVPLAAPLIAGPGVMTAAIFFAMMNGVLVAIICITLAVFLNLLFMLASAKIGRFLEVTKATGPLIRISGLIVTAVAMQMMFNGCGMWLQKVL